MTAVGARLEKRFFRPASSAIMGAHCSTRTLSPARSPTPGSPPAQADAVTNAVRLAAEHGDHVSSTRPGTVTFARSRREVHGDMPKTKARDGSADAGRRARAAWPVRVFALGDEPSDDLSGRTTAEERLAMMWPLAVDAWTASGRPLPEYPRHLMPVRVIRNKRETGRPKDRADVETLDGQGVPPRRERGRPDG